MTAGGSKWRPEREVEIVAGTPPGGGLDRCARALLQALEANRILDVPARVTNMPGEGGRGAWIHLDRHRGDPHILCVSSINLTTDNLLGESPFRHEVAFTPLALLYNEPLAFLARSGSAVDSGAAFLARCTADARSLTIALSIALGNPNHIALAKVVRQAGGDVTAPRLRVFDSALDAVADVTAGHSDVAVVTAVSAAKELAAGALRALALAAPRRAGGLYAQTPTWLELGVDCVVESWRGASGAHGITPDQAAFWEQALAQAMASSEWKQALERYYWTPMYRAGASLREYLAREREELATTLGELGLIR
jgi:putative tricarboxylic transport membrane protein